MLDLSPISAVEVVGGRPELLLRWRSSAAAGTTHQVYVGGNLVWSGTGTTAAIARPTGPGNHQILIGAAPAGLGRQNNLASLGSTSPLRTDRATLVWFGGTYLGAGLLGFRIYAGADRMTPLATIPAYPGGVVLDGYGRGGYGRGGYGHAASTYRWTSGLLGPGPWSLTVVPYDASGATGPEQTWTGTIVGPPRAPSRLVASVNPTTGQVVLAWSSSPIATT